MRSDWKTVDLEEISKEITVGFVGSMTSEYQEHGIPFFRSKNIKAFELDWNDIKFISPEFHAKIKKSSLKYKDVAIIRTGKPGTACVIPENVKEANCSDLVIVRVDEEKVNPYYLSYYINSIAVGQVNSHLVGAVQQHFNVSSAKKIKIHLPSIEEQNNIAEVLNNLTNKITNNNQINQTLEEMAQALFKSWFVDFEPVIAKRTAIEKGEDPQLAAMEVISGKAAQATSNFGGKEYDELRATADLFPNNLVESELGLIPEGWKFGTLNDITSLIIDHRGKTPKKLGGDWSSSGKPAISAKNIKNGKLIKHEMIRFVSQELYEKWMVNELQKGDIILTSEGPLGELFFITDDTKYCLSQRLYAIRANEHLLTPDYLYYYCRSHAFQQELEGRSTGTTVTGIRQSELRKTRILIPTYDVTKMFSTKVILLLQKIGIGNKSNLELSEIRNTLLPKLLSGDIELKTE